MITKLIALDWRATKMYHWTFIFIIPISVFFGWFFSSVFMMPLVVMYVHSNVMNAFLAEEKSDLNMLYLAMPIHRRSIVRARYVWSLLLIVVGIAVGTAMIPIANSISNSRWYLDFGGWLTVMVISFFSCALFNLFMLPPMFKIGYLKGKTWGIFIPIAIFMVAGGVLSAVSTLGDLPIRFLSFASDNMLLVSGGIFVLGAGLFGISYMISLRFYERRDF